MSYSKFRAKKVEFDHHSFASQLEAAVYLHLKSCEQEGGIKDLKCQQTVYLTKARIIYKPDFSFLDTMNGLRTFAEAKGFETPEWRIKRRLWEWYGEGPLWIYKGSAKSFRLHETITPISY
jgi:hypothetical protein